MIDSIWTVGHSTRSIDDFLALLAESSIEVVADVRRFPGSRRHPHFGAESLSASLSTAGLAYEGFPQLGGRRDKRAPGSANNAWKVEAFNAYADFMECGEFQEAIERLAGVARDSRTAVLCAEALPWRCHRRLIADAMIVRGWVVDDIIGPGKVIPHPLTEFARVDGLRISYPAEPLFGEG